MTLLLVSLLFTAGQVASSSVVLAHHQEGHTSQSDTADEHSSAPHKSSREKERSPADEPAPVSETTTTSTTVSSPSSSEPDERPQPAPTTTIEMSKEEEAAFRPPESLPAAADDESNTAHGPVPFTSTSDFVRENSSRILAAFATRLENLLPPALAEVVLSPFLVVDLVVGILARTSRAISAPFLLLLAYVVWGETMRLFRFFTPPTVIVKRKRRVPRQIVKPALAFSSGPEDHEARRPPRGPRRSSELPRSPLPQRARLAPATPLAPPSGSPATPPSPSPPGPDQRPAEHPGPVPRG